MATVTYLKSIRHSALPERLSLLLLPVLICVRAFHTTYTFDRHQYGVKLLDELQQLADGAVSPGAFGKRVPALMEPLRLELDEQFKLLVVGAPDLAFGLMEYHLKRMEDATTALTSLTQAEHAEALRHGVAQHGSVLALADALTARYFN